MRSLMLGDCQHYASPYMRGIAQAMKLLGRQHAEVSIRTPARVIEQRIKLWKPKVIWTHMVLWPPVGSPSVSDIVAILERAAKRGARVVIHDGDAKQGTRYPRDLSAWCSLALVNHAYDRSAWKVPLLRWPYFAQTQQSIAPPVEALRCALFFAGHIGREPVYAARSALLERVRARGVDLRLPAAGENTIDRTPEIAASADAVLGFGRPEVPGWVDTRCFQYPGAGGVLLHDDAQGYLEPWVHFVPYNSGDADSVADALDRLRALSDSDRMAIRERAFVHVQQHHSSVARARQVFAHLGVA
jgi:hypothetical protein